MAVDLIIKGSLSLSRIILANDIGNAGIQLGLYLFGSQMQTVLVINGDLFISHLDLEIGQALRRAETIIGLSPIDQFFGIL